MLNSFYSKIVGITSGNRQSIAARCEKNLSLRLEREPNNIFDSNAVAVYCPYGQLGYIPKDTAVTVVQLLNNHSLRACTIETVTGGNGKFVGINIKITYEDGRCSRPKSSTRSYSRNNDYDDGDYSYESYRASAGWCGDEDDCPEEW